MKQRIINKYTALGLAALIALVTTFFFTQDKPQVVEADETIERQSQFSFDGAPDWRLGPTNQTSIALFHDRDGCFVSAQHYQGDIDADKAKRFKAEAYFSHQGYKTTPLATRTLSMNTDAGAIRYDLGQSSVITPAGKPKVKGGQGFGYFRLSTGYIKVETHCDDASQLPATIPALEAIEFSANNS